MGGVGVFWATRVMEIVKKHDSGGLVWKRIKLTSTRKANAKKRLLRVWQNEAVLKACSEPPPSKKMETNPDGTERLGKCFRTLESNSFTCKGSWWLPCHDSQGNSSFQAAGVPNFGLYG
ncbi:hypothetical protein Nepgr_029243 [Nepenthes gracilis]|uniref:Uncharacterized protein n=1 Tax=Nepenthes gracilis TaxID=150966 RepID=A0AAD3TD86_NEPGR|nr:hypothetical protein Nepgr_029243 [Nepenthes gracilis]